MDDPQTSHAATIHAAITALSVSVGRLEERMSSLHAALGHHMKEEHKAFNEALEEVQTISAKVAALQSVYDQSRGAWWMLAKIVAVITTFVAAISWLADFVKG